MAHNSTFYFTRHRTKQHRTFTRHEWGCRILRTNKLHHPISSSIIQYHPADINRQQLCVFAIYIFIHTSMNIHTLWQLNIATSRHIKKHPPPILANPWPAPWNQGTTHAQGGAWLLLLLHLLWGTTHGLQRWHIISLAAKAGTAGDVVTCWWSGDGMGMSWERCGGSVQAATVWWLVTSDIIEGALRNGLSFWGSFSVLCFVKQKNELLQLIW